VSVGAGGLTLTEGEAAMVLAMRRFAAMRKRVPVAISMYQGPVAGGNDPLFTATVQILAGDGGAGFTPLWFESNIEPARAIEGAVAGAAAKLNAAAANKAPQGTP